MRWCIRCTKVTYRNNSINSFSLSYGIFLTKPLQIIVQKILICFIAALTIALIQFWNKCRIISELMQYIMLKASYNWNLVFHLSITTTFTFLRIFPDFTVI